MADIKQIKVGNTNYNISGAAIVLEDNGTTTNGVWLAKTNQISTLEDGQLFLYKLVKGTSFFEEQTTLTITGNGVSLGPKNVYLDNHGNFLCHANYYLFLIYFSNKFNIINPPYTTPDALYSGNYNFSTKIGTEFSIGSSSIRFSYNNGVTAFTGFEHNIDSSRTMFKASNRAKLMINYSDATPDMQFINDNEEVQMRITGSKIYASNHLELCAIDGGDRIEINDNQTKIYGNYGSHAKFNFGAGTTLTLFDDSGDEKLTLTSNTVIGSGSMQLRTNSSNSPKLYIDPSNGTKIFMPLIDGYSAGPELAFANYSHGIGAYINRPIYLGSPNENASDSSSSLRYNADEDCIEFKFE